MTDKGKTKQQKTSLLKFVSTHRRSSALTEVKKKRTRILLVGSTKSGKTTLAKRFINNEFSEKYQPTVEDSYYHNYKYGKRHFHLEIIDMPSPFMFPVMRDLHVKVADAIMLIYEIDNQLSYTEAMDAWKRIRGLREDSLPIVIVGTKQDLMTVSRNVEECMANMTLPEISDTFDVKHILTSAKNNVGVTEAFQLCLDEIIPGMDQTSSSLTLSDCNDDENSSSCSCCCGVLSKFFTK